MKDQFHLKGFQDYLISRDRSPVTVQGYLGDIRLFARWFSEEYEEALNPELLSNEAVRAYKQHLLEKHAKPKTINRRLAALASYAHWLQQAGHVDSIRNPVQGIKAIRETQMAPRWLDRKERAALLRAVDKEVEFAMRNYPRLRLIYLRDAAIIQLILNAGLRVSEIVDLRLIDVILNKRNGSVVVREGKGIKRREIPLNSQARKFILDYIRVRPTVENDHLFLGQQYQGVKNKTVQRAVKRFGKVAGLEEVTAHILRHTFAKSLIDQGVSLENVAMLLGHSNLNTTRIYTTPGKRDLEEAVQKLER